MHRTIRNSDRYYGYEADEDEWNYGYGGWVDAVAYVIATVKTVNEKARLWMLKSDNVPDKNEIFLLNVFNKKYPPAVYNFKVPTDQMLKPTPDKIVRAGSESQGWGESDDDDQPGGGQSDDDDHMGEIQFTLDAVPEDEEEDVREVAIPDMSETLIEDGPGEPGLGEEPVDGPGEPGFGEELADGSSFYYDLGTGPFVVDQHIKKDQQITFQEIVIENQNHLSGRIEISGESDVVDDKGFTSIQKNVFLSLDLAESIPKPSSL